MSVYTTIVYIMAYIGLFITFFYILNLLSHYRKKVHHESKDLLSVTICIPAYNEEKSIGPTIESAMALRYPEGLKEIIVVDDGSVDNTLKEARKYADRGIRIFHKKNGGKGSALNFGIEKAKGEIFVSMDADTFAQPDCLEKMMRKFYSDKVMSVTPSMIVTEPKGFLPRIQQIEYYLGIFLRKSFSTVNAIHITAGSFSAYRMSFFKKYGGYEVGNITEDMEIALRIQANNFVIENEPHAVVFTIPPRKFRSLISQRRRWYTGLIRNLWAYRKLFGFKTGALGTVVLPAAIITVMGSIILTTYVVIKTVNNLRDELLLLDAIDFKFGSVIEINTYLFERFFFSLFTNPIFIITFITICTIAGYVTFGRMHMTHKEKMPLNFFLFIGFYSMLFVFWWSISIFYVVFNKEVTWRSQHGKE